MWKHFFVSCGIFLTCLFCQPVFAHGNGDGHDVSDPSGIGFDNISGNTSLRRSTCLVYGTDEAYLQQALGYHNDLVTDNGDGLMDRRCYWSLVFMSAYTMRLTSPLIFQGVPARVASVEMVGVLINLNTDPATPTGYVTFVLDARGLGDCPVRFAEGVRAHVQHLTILVDNPRKAFCRIDATTPIYTSLSHGHTTTASQSVDDLQYSTIDTTVTIQPEITFPESSSGGVSGATGGSSGSGGVVGVAGSGGSESLGTGGGSYLGTGGSSGMNGTGGATGGSGGTRTGSGGSSSVSLNDLSNNQQQNSSVTFGDVTKVDSGGCNRIP